MKNIFIRRLSLGLVVILSLLVFSKSAFATMYTPGSTLTPGCGPTDTNCGVIAPVSTSDTMAAGSLLYSSSPTEYSLLSAGTNGQILSVGSGGALTWIAAPTGAGASASTIVNTPSGSITATDVQSALNFLDTSKLTSALTNGYIFVGNTSGKAAAVAVSGDIAMDNTGLTTIQNGAVNSAKIADGSISNTDINSSAAIDWTKLSKSGAKISDLDAPAYTGNAGKVLAVNSTANGLQWVSALTSALSSGNMFVGNSSGVATETTMSGDVAISNTGSTTIQPNAVALGTDTTGNYVADATTNSGLVLTGTEAATLGIQLADSSLGLSASGIKLNTANANTWTGIQTLVSPIFNTGVSGTAISTDGTFTSPSDTILASQKATATLVNSRVNGLSWRPSVALIDTVDTTRPTTTATTIDGQTITDTNRVLFTNLATNNNEVYLASVSSGNITWTLQTDGKNGDGTPASADTIFISAGTSNGGKTFTYSGTAWNLGGSLAGGLLKTNNLSDVNNVVTARTNLGLGTGDSPTFAGLTVTGAITAPTTTNTINGLIISSGTLSGVNGITFLSGNFDMSSSSGTFKTGTGAVTINGDTTLASGKSITAAGGATNLDMSASTGTLKTGTGAVTLNGNTTVTTGKTLTLADMTKGSILFAGTSGVASQDNANIYWDSTNHRLGIGTTSPGAGLTNALSTLYTATAISDVASGGNIGAAASTVDVSTTFNVSQSTAGQTLTLPTPSTTTAGRIAYVSNTGSSSFTMYGATVASGKGLTLQWSGSAWVPLNSVPAGSSVTLSSLTAASATNAIDNLTYGQTWNWSTATTQTPMTITANALTTGSGLSLTTSSANLASTKGLFYVANSGASTSGILARFQSNSTGESGMTVLANGNVGVGTTNPQERLHIMSNDQGSARMRIENNGGGRPFDLVAGINNTSQTGFSIYDASAGATRLVIDNNGNVGIGTTTPANLLTLGSSASGAWDSAYAPLDFKGYGYFYGSANGTGWTGTGYGQTGWGNNQYYSGVVSHAVGTGAASYILQGTGQIDFEVAPSVSAGSALTFIDAMHIANSGNVGIGTASPAYKLHVYNAGQSIVLNNGTATNTGGGVFAFGIGSGAIDGGIGNLSAITGSTSNNDVMISAQNNNGLWLRTAGAYPIYFKTTDVERMRIAANGNVGIGTTNSNAKLEVVDSSAGSYSGDNDGGNGGYVAVIKNNYGNENSHGLEIKAGSNFFSGANAIGFFRPDGTYLGGISQGLGAVSYNSSSDERLKNNIVDDTKYGVLDLMKIKVKDFDYKIDPTHKTMNGFIAQQLETIYPDAVTVGSDATDANGNLTKPWAVDYGRLTPLLVKSIQDQQKEIESLKTGGGVSLNSLNELALSGVLSVSGHVTLGADTVGEAKVAAGSTSVTVTFTTPYTNKPIITVTPQDAYLGMAYGVKNITANGFDIVLQPTQSSDVTFDWHAFAQVGNPFMVASVIPAVVTLSTPVVVSPTCTDSQVLNTTGTACVDKTPATLTCTSPQVLSTDGKSCVDKASDQAAIDKKAADDQADADAAKAASDQAAIDKKTADDKAASDQAAADAAKAAAAQVAEDAAAPAKPAPVVVDPVI